MNCRWLSKEDRILAVERIRMNGQGVGNKHFKFYQLKEALLDPLSWAFFFYALIADIPNGNCSSITGEWGRNETDVTQVVYPTSSRS
jgi:ACS family allantoate permease-like MFS transporter